jgi:hypothetical protein
MGGMTVVQRIGEIPVRMEAAALDGLAAVLFQNREILAPLLARDPKGMPGSDWLLTEDGEFGNAVSPIEPDRTPAKNLRSAVIDPGAQIVDELFDAKGAVPSTVGGPIAAFLRNYRS